MLGRRRRVFTPRAANIHTGSYTKHQPQHPTNNKHKHSLQVLEIRQIGERSRIDVHIRPARPVDLLRHLHDGLRLRDLRLCNRLRDLRLHVLGDLLSGGLGLQPVAPPVLGHEVEAEDDEDEDLEAVADEHGADAEAVLGRVLRAVEERA